MTTKNKYAVLQEMNDEEVECWLYFIKHTGNEKELEFLQKQLETIEWHMMEEESTFDLDTTHLVSETTAKEMTKVELNHYQWHRKFDGKLKMINFKLKKKDSNEDKMVKVIDMLGYGQIENYIDEEDIDEEDLTDTELTDNDANDTKEEEEEEENIINDIFASSF